MSPAEKHVKCETREKAEEKAKAKKPRSEAKAVAMEDIQIFGSAKQKGQNTHEL